jgi:glycosyltransferase involved in cell wall biosynthesis
LRAAGVRVHVGPPAGIRGATAWLAGLLAQERTPTLLHTHFSYWDLPAALTALRFEQATVVWHLHSFLTDEALARGRNLVRFAVIGRLVDRILCVGPEVYYKAIARRAPAERTQVFPVGIDTHRLSPVSAAERRAARTRMGLGDRSAVLLLFGRDWEQKGGPLLLATLRELRARGRDVIAIVVDVPAETDTELAPLELAGLVRRMPPTDGARELFAAADIFVAASVVEGMGLAPIEAMACGTPVVASDVPSLRYTAAGLSACRFAPRLPTAFADAIEAELDAGAPDRDARLAQSRTAILRTYSLEGWSERLLSLYLELIATGSV